MAQRLRAGELVTLRWDAFDFAHGHLHVSRLKGSAESVHPLSGRELRALRRLKREQDSASPFIFTSERGSPFTTASFRKMVARLGVAARFDFPVHPHMLRHACGYKLANDGVDTRSLTFNTRCAIPSWRRPASRTSGAIDRPARAARASGGAISLSIASHLLVMVASNERPRLLIDEVNMKLNSLRLLVRGISPIIE